MVNDYQVRFSTTGLQHATRALGAMAEVCGLLTEGMAGVTGAFAKIAPLLRAIGPTRQEKRRWRRRVNRARWTANMRRSYVPQQDLIQDFRRAPTVIVPPWRRDGDQATGDPK